MGRQTAAARSSTAQFHSRTALRGVTSATTQQNGMDVQEAKLISFFGRLNYNINDKYLLSFSLRRDGSSRFGSDNAWVGAPTRTTS